MESGVFTVLNLNADLTTSPPTVMSFAATFTVQSCDGEGPIGGHVYYNYEQPINATIVTFPQLPEADVSIPYTDNLIAAGGRAPYTWRLAGGQMPPGLTLGANGVITGTPAQSGVYTFTAQATDTEGSSAQSVFTLPVIEPLGFTSPAVLPVAIAGQQFQTTLTATGGSPPYTFSLEGGENLPAGITLDSSGNLSGTTFVSAEYFSQFIVTDSKSRKASMVLELDVLTPGGAQGVRRLAMSSDGEYVGLGLNYFYGDGGGQWGAGASVDPVTGQVNDILLEFSGPADSGDFWSLEFSTRELGVPLTPGVYNNAQRAAFAEPGHPGLDVSGEGRGCDTDAGSFTVLNAVFEVNGSTVNVVSFAAEFVQGCEGDIAHPLRGTIFYGVVPPALTKQSPSVSSVTYKAKKGKMTVNGKNFDSQCTLVIDGQQWQINPNDKKREELGPVLKAVGVTLSPGTHEIQVCDVNGDLSPPFQLVVKPKD